MRQGAGESHLRRPKKRARPDPASLASMARETHPWGQPPHRAKLEFELRRARRSGLVPNPPASATSLGQLALDVDERYTTGPGFVPRRARRSGLVPNPPASATSLGQLALDVDERYTTGPGFVPRRARRSGLVPTPPASATSLGQLALDVDQRYTRARASCLAEPEEAGSSRPRPRRQPRSDNSPSASTSATHGPGFRASPSPKKRASPDPARVGTLARTTRPRRRPALHTGPGFVPHRARRSGLVPTPPASATSLGQLALGVDQRYTRARASCLSQPEGSTSPGSTRPARADRANLAQLGESLGLARY